MDNLCHTLVGAALGEAGLRRRTRFGNATLMIASNLPDIDVLAFAAGTPVVALRRGWTHGVLAQVLLPIALTGVILAFARRQSRATPASDGPPVRAGSLLLLSYIGVIGHVLMDLLNTYGVRLLMPFEQRWFYGDVLFIIDPWMWLSLGLGVWGARRWRSAAPARAALVIAGLYVIAMSVAAQAARGDIVSRWQQVEGRPPRAAMVGPVPVNPLARDVIIDAGDHYELGSFTWRPRRVQFSSTIIEKHDDDPRVTAAREAPNVRAFLVWSRFPFWTFEPAPGGTRVTVGDVRFVGRRAVGGRTFTESVVVSAFPDS